MPSWRDIEDPEYEELTSITRSLHLGQAMSSYGKQRLMSHKIVSKTVDLNVKVLWFAPTRPMNENNMYGNVSFTLDWRTALEQLGPYLYCIDQNENSKFYYGRVLLTNKQYEFLTPVDDGGHGMPLMLFDNKHYAAIASEGLLYVLEIGIEVDRHEENWLYKNCKIETNDHSFANTLLYKGGPYKPCICHRFNYFNEECPSPYTLQRTRKILKKRCPLMLRDEPAGKTTRTRVKKRRRKQVFDAVAVPAAPAAASKKQVSAVPAAATADTKKHICIAAAPAAASKKQVSAVPAAATAATKKHICIARSPAAVESSDDYVGYDEGYHDYYERRYPAYNSYPMYNHPTPKKSDEGISTGKKIVLGVLVAAYCWYRWRLKTPTTTFSRGETTFSRGDWRGWLLEQKWSLFSSLAPKCGGEVTTIRSNL